ncbi:MAG: (2Fe-2S) ferredoxin domain-containing protein [Planctomycetota bacterium]
MAKKITSPEELKALRDKVKAGIDLRSGQKQITVTVHMGTCGIAAGAREVLSQLATELSQAGVRDVSLRQTGCLGLCDREPMLSLADASGKTFVYGKLNRKKVHEIVHEHVVGGSPVEAYIVTT